MQPALCAAWPSLQGDNFLDLVASIRDNGLLHAIVVDRDDLVLDGKDRDKACGIAGVAPRYETYTGDDPAGFILAQNKHRKHLTKGMLAMAVMAMEKVAPHGTNQHKNEELNSFNSLESLAKDSGIDKATLSHAATVLKRGTTAVVDLVKGGKVRPDEAAAYVKKTPPSQQQADPAVINAGSTQRKPLTPKAEVLQPVIRAAYFRA